MKSRIILLDIDGTLFDSISFLNDFYNKITTEFNLSKKSINLVKTIYNAYKDHLGYFLPDTFLDTVSESIPSVNKNLLHKTFWNIDLIEQNMYKDTSVIKDLSDFAVIGIFSKGDENFQKQKISFLKEFLNDENVYIFPDKIDRIQEVFEKYKDYIVYLVDNEIEVLIKAKNLFPKIEIILIDRKNIYQETNKILKIKTLEDLKSIIYD